MTLTAQEPPPTAPCSRRVLVVEDDHALRGAVVELLEDNGYTPVEASNGAEALQALRTVVPYPCLILLDVMMPVMDGYQFRDEQMKDPALRGIPVLVVTAHASVTAESIASATVLRKPLDLDALLAIIARYCGPAT